MLNWIIGAVVGAFIAGAFVGWGYEHEKLVKYQAHVEELAAAQKRVTDEINESNKRKTKEVASDYEKRIAAIRSTYGRVYNNGSGLMPGQTCAAQALDGRPSYPVLAEQCAETTQQLISLQQFIRETQ